MRSNRDAAMTLTRFRLLFAAAILVAINLALIAMSLPTLRHSLLPETIGVTTARIPIAIQVLESDGSPAQARPSNASRCFAKIQFSPLTLRDARMACWPSCLKSTSSAPSVSSRRTTRRTSKPLKSGRTGRGAGCIRQVFPEPPEAWPDSSSAVPSVDSTGCGY